MYTMLPAFVALACVAFGSAVAVNEVDLEEPNGQHRGSDALWNATKLLYRRRRAPVKDMSIHGVTDAKRIAALNKHNAYRTKVSPSAVNMNHMRWNWQLEEMAQDWADACDYKHGQPERANVPFPAIGQNLYVSTNEYDIEKAIEMWFEEEVNYDYNTNTCQAGKLCGHYTQLIWANTKEIGCGIAYCETTKNFENLEAYYIVCNYGPSGNYIGEMPYKSGSSCSECPPLRSNCESNLCREDPPCKTKMCLNRGSVDLTLCECKCDSEFHGSSCENGAVGDVIDRLRMLTMLITVLVSGVIFG